MATNRTPCRSGRVECRGQPHLSSHIVAVSNGKHSYIHFSEFIVLDLLPRDSRM
jgi:hypothetical protein